MTINRSLLGEPFERSSSWINEILHQNHTTLEQYKPIVEDMSFKEFMRFKVKWLSNINCKWLIQGHLDAESALAVVETAEVSLSARKIPEDDLKVKRCVKMRGRTVYTAIKENESETNPNSACFSIFAVCEIRDQQKFAVLDLITSLLREGFFTTLRTKEQLGYIC